MEAAFQVLASYESIGPFLAYQFLEDDAQTEIPTTKTAGGFNFSVADDPTLAAMFAEPTPYRKTLLRQAQPATWPISCKSSANQGTEASKCLPPLTRENSIVPSLPPRSSSWPTSPLSPLRPAATA